MTAHRLLTPRWLAVGGVVVLAGIIAVAVLLRSPACAAPPTATAHQGKATFYDLAGTEGNCNFKPPADDLYVALGRTQYSSGLSCGSYLDVTGPKGTVRVKVFDSCPECTVGWLDLSRTAFKKIADPVQGVVPISYRAVPNARTPGPLSITFAKGSSRYWWAILVDNHANPIASVKAKAPGGSWMTASRTDYNFWLINRDTGNGPFTIKMTDVYGHTATAAGVELIPQKKQATTVRLTGAVSTGTASSRSAPSSSVPKKKATPSKKPSPRPSASVSSSAAAAPLAVATDVAVEPPVALAAAPAGKHC